MANRKRHKLNRALSFFHLTSHVGRPLFSPPFFPPLLAAPHPETEKRKGEKRGEKKRDCAAGGWVGYEVWVWGGAV